MSAPQLARLHTSLQHASPGWANQELNDLAAAVKIDPARLIADVAELLPKIAAAGVRCGTSGYARRTSAALGHGGAKDGHHIGVRTSGPNVFLYPEIFDLVNASGTGWKPENADELARMNAALIKGPALD